MDLYYRALDEGRNQAFWDSYRALPARDQETFDNATLAALWAFMNFVEADEAQAALRKGRDRAPEKNGRTS
jgi:hypothetical protein